MLRLNKGRTMKLNKKYYLAIFSVLGIQAFLGIYLANAVPCESEILEEMQSNKENNAQLSQTNDPNVYFFGLNAVYFNSPDDFWPSMKKRVEELRSNPGSETWPDKGSLRLQITGAKENIQKYGSDKHLRTGDNLVICYSQALLDANGEVDTILNRNSSSKNNNKSSPSNSGASSNQSTSNSAQFNSPESFNLQVSQTNKQNYQAMQQAYDKAMQGKGKKNNLQAVATECMKNNPSQLTYKNNCKQPINFSYCFSGITPGYKNENPETLVEMSCQNGQFGTLTLGAGESIPGSYKGMVLEGVGCKSPSQPIVAFDGATKAATGRCSF
jgi:hypothetical protein